MPNTTLIFLAALATGFVLQMWLYIRHSRYVAAHRATVPIAFAERVLLTAHQQAADYTQAKVRLEQLDLILRTVLILFWTLGGGLDYIFHLWAKTTLTPLWAQELAILTVLLLSTIIDLPLSWWRTFRLEQRFGFNCSTPALFYKDMLLNLVLGLILGGPLLLAILWLMNQAGTWWWLYAWGVLTSFTLLMQWAYPTLILPLFNRFTPLETGELRTHIEALLTKCGFNSSGIFTMDGSKRSTHGNAYFAGLGRTKRIVLFDTLIERLSIEELEAVLAHELGHYKNHHLQILLVLNTTITLIGLALLGWLANQPWFYQDLGITTPSPGAALLLFLFIVPVFSQFLSPLSAWLLRYHEYQADAFATTQTGGVALIRALVKLYKDDASTLTPDPWFSAYHDSHPPAPLRVQHIETLLREAKA